MPPTSTAEVPDTLRLFIGIRPDARAQRYFDAMVSHCKQQLGGAQRQLRWTSHANRHLTLAFLGETATDLVPAIEAGMEQIAGEVSSCIGQVVSVHPFPKSRSRLLAAELLPNPQLDHLYALCRRLMVDLNMPPESAAYRPHVTLARSRHGLTRLSPLATDFAMQLDNIALYQSLTPPGGSQYLPLCELPLRG